MKIDFEKIDYYIEKQIDKKPAHLAVDQQEWEDALIGARNTLAYSLVGNEISTDQAWSQIFFSALYFCIGMEYAQVKAGLKKESNYPRY